MLVCYVWVVLEARVMGAIGSAEFDLKSSTKSSSRPGLE